MNPDQPTVVTMDGYCVDFGKAVPRAGTVFRLKNAVEQTRQVPVKRILAGSHYLRLFGGLHPDTDPTEYFHAIRQWAIWTYREGFDERRFGEAFVEHAKKNLRAAGRPWTSDLDRAIQQILPGRWQDIQAVLRESGLAGAK